MISFDSDCYAALGNRVKEIKGDELDKWIVNVDVTGHQKTGYYVIRADISIMMSKSIWIEYVIEDNDSFPDEDIITNLKAGNIVAFTISDRTVRGERKEEREGTIGKGVRGSKWS